MTKKQWREDNNFGYIDLAQKINPSSKIDDIILSAHMIKQFCEDKMEFRKVENKPVDLKVVSKKNFN